MNKPYSQLMIESPVYLTLTIDTQQPVELSDFVGQFTSLGNEFERFVKLEHPDLQSDATFYVREVRSGSTIVEMFPQMAVAAPFLASVDHVMIVEDFVRRWGSRLTSLIKGGDKQPVASKSELKDWSDAVSAIARDPDASSKLEASTFEDGKKKIRASFIFSTKEARSAQLTIEHQKRELDKVERADKERVLMVFTRSDINNATVGKPSGEKVKIEEISDKSLSLTYASDMAEQRLKHEIREADENVFKKAFVVDVNIKSINGKPVAYAVTHVHDVIDIED